MGDDCVHTLRGEFAFVLYDSKADKMFAARDRFGIKPLFYVEYADELLLASEAKALFAAGIPATWNVDSVIRNLFLSIAQDQSLFDGVRQIPPGHTLTSRNGTIT